MGTVTAKERQKQITLFYGNYACSFFCVTAVLSDIVTAVLSDFVNAALSDFVTAVLTLLPLFCLTLLPQL